MNKVILIVEDELKLASLLHDYLQQANFLPHCLASGLEVLPWLEQHHADLILLDLMLPGRNGMDICRELRTFSNVPVIMLTARVEEIDRVLGLELGADDYICKPFSPREVVARVKAVLRRAGAPGPARLDEETLVLDEHGYKAILHGVDLGLTAVEFKLLSYLAGNPGRIYSRDQLMACIYTEQRIVNDRTIDSHIKKLRRKIAEAAPGEELVHSVYGVGYKFEKKEDGRRGHPSHTLLD
ncbi:MAG: response regulator [Desulfobulbaceae bacterium]|nr:response regulator [Desulfobulbaceae bacterium]